MRPQISDYFPNTHGMCSDSPPTIKSNKTHRTFLEEDYCVLVRSTVITLLRVFNQFVPVPQINRPNRFFLGSTGLRNWISWKCHWKTYRWHHRALRPPTTWVPNWYQTSEGSIFQFPKKTSGVPSWQKPVCFCKTCLASKTISFTCYSSGGWLKILIPSARRCATTWKLFRKGCANCSGQETK